MIIKHKLIITPFDEAKAANGKNDLAVEVVGVDEVGRGVVVGLSGLRRLRGTGGVSSRAKDVIRDSKSPALLVLGQTKSAHIPLYLYPFLNTTSKSRPFEYLRLTSLGLIGALVKGPTEKDSSSEAVSGKESPDLAVELDPDDKDDTDQDDEGSDDCEQKSCQLGARQYKHLIAIHAGKPKNELKEALRAGIGKIKCLSLSETTLEKAA
ncbi:hypothetical protein TEA_030178 [Camellia sinensis var. sinensis]|uniref:Uncharacterized protein n=1 Tax=Camellia sinensis var. sinensis TaxID=542762 RepID=A0A4S4D948_CAMSN|nr:hypothetical protein TEA_030178 [Camellia sinensis var. sinensis]